MPEDTVRAFADHGQVSDLESSDIERALGNLDDLTRVGIDLADVARTLEEEGVTSFAKSFDEVIERLEAKAAQLGMSS